MNLTFSSLMLLGVLGVSGCPLDTLSGTPPGHSRPIGHIDTTIAVSPKDDELLFNAAGKGGRDLYALHLADLKVRRIAETPDYEVDPSFSSDGKRIVYAAGVPRDRADHIFTIGTDGSSKTQLTKSKWNDSEPRFSPDGSMVVFARCKTYNWGGLAHNWSAGEVICVVGADGKGERQLTPDGGSVFGPSFSSDGRAIRYLSNADGLYSVPTDGSKMAKKISPISLGASISPDGNKVAFSDGKFAPDCELFIAKLDGTAKLQITTTDRGCFKPVFANLEDRVYYLVEEWPDGTSGEPKSSVWSVKTNGTEQRLLADWPLFDDPMSWKPREMP